MKWRRMVNPPSMGPTQVLRLCAISGTTSMAPYSATVPSCPQSNILGWGMFIMARPMYTLISTSPFRLPTDPEPLAIYYPPPTQIVNAQGAPVLDAAGQPMFVAQATIGCAEQAPIDACFSRARNYWLSCMNIRKAVYNVLDDNIDNAFKL